MADIEEGELKEEEKTTVDKATADKGRDSDLECQGEDKNAGKSRMLGNSSSFFSQLGGGLRLWPHISAFPLSWATRSCPKSP